MSEYILIIVMICMCIFMLIMYYEFNKLYDDLDEIFIEAIEEEEIAKENYDAIIPEYYQIGFDGYDVIDFINAFGLNFELGNVIKYIARAGNKPGNDTLQDLQKAEQYLHRVISRLKENA